MRTRFNDETMVAIVEQFCFHLMEHGAGFEHDTAYQTAEFIAMADGTGEFTAHEWQMISTYFARLSPAGVAELREIVAAENMTQRRDRRRAFLNG